METLKVGVIGAGRIGRLHAENLARRIQGAELLWVADVVGEAAAKAAREFGIPKYTTDYHEVLSDLEIDAVLICTSTDTHAEIIRAAAAARKHIFCEKPLALDLAEIDSVLAAVKEAGVILQVGFHRRFDPNFRRLKELIVEGSIGRPWLLKITSYDPAPPPIAYIRASGGIFLDMIIHDFDMVRFMSGAEIVEIDGDPTLRIEMDDPTVGADAPNMDRLPFDEVLLFE